MAAINPQNRDSVQINSVKTDKENTNEVIKLENPLERLNDNKNKAIDHAADVVDNRLEANSKKDLSEAMLEALGKGELTSVISLLSQLKDLRSNIKTYISDDLGNGTKSLVRDGREAVDPLIIAPESYAMMCANHARSAIMVAENAKERGEITSEQLSVTKRKIQSDAITQITAIHAEFAGVEPKELSVRIQNDKGNKNSFISKLEDEVKAFNSSLVKTLDAGGIEKAKKQMKVTKDFANFSDEHYHVSTISEVEGSAVIETEAMNLGLTPTQKKMFKAVMAANPNKKGKLEASGENMEWFNDQPRWKQDLIKKSAPAILAETKVIPTQLRKELPLLRNAYTKIISIKKSNENEFKPCFETMHSGTLTTEIPQKSKIPFMGAINQFGTWLGVTKNKTIMALTQGNVEQLKQFSSNGQVNLNVLTSPANPAQTVDVADSAYLKQDAKSGIFKTTTPFNVFRKTLGGGGRDLSGYESSLKAIAAKLDNGSVKNYLEGKGNYKDIIIDPNDKSEKGKALQSLIDAKKDMDSLALLKVSDDEHMHSQISEKMAIAVGNLNRLEPKWSIPAINISCASGKDRTQMDIAGATSRAIGNALEIPDLNSIAKEVAKSGGAQYLSGNNGGGTIGCFGQKLQTAAVANKTMFNGLINCFGQRTADMNKFSTKDGLQKKMQKAIFKPVGMLLKYCTGPSAVELENIKANKDKSAVVSPNVPTAKASPYEAEVVSTPVVPARKRSSSIGLPGQ